MNIFHRIYTRLCICDSYASVNTEFNQFNRKSITDYRYELWVNLQSQE